MVDPKLASEKRKESFKELLEQPVEIKYQRAIATMTKFIMDRGGVDKVYISFSGGKDSCVLLSIARTIHPEIKAVYCDTGLEYPEINEHVLKLQNEWGNIDIIKPKIGFKQVITEYGYPIISKETSQRISQFHNLTKGCKSQILRFEQVSKTKWAPFLSESAPKVSDICCHKLKKDPFKKYEKATGRSPITGVMAQESMLRRQQYIRNGCTSFSSGRHQAKPLSLWTEDNIWEYIKYMNVPIAKIYDAPEIDRTGCIFCGFGIHMNGGVKFLALKRLHPKMYWYTLKNLGLAKILSFMVSECRTKLHEDLIKDVELIVSECYKREK